MCVIWLELCLDLEGQVLTCVGLVVVTKASAFVGLGSKSSRQLDAKHAVLGMDAPPSDIDIYLVALYPKPGKEKCWCRVA